MIDKLQERNTFLEEKLSTIQHKLLRVDDTVDKLAHPKVPANHPSEVIDRVIKLTQDNLGHIHVAQLLRISFDIQAS